MIGRVLGPYEILEQLGKGGMGEVYRARDALLDRDVAIKVLSADFAADQDRLARFEREAKMLASLNHANIAAIYGLEDAAGVRFIAMELVEGETLGERIERKGKLELDEALDLGCQIAAALQAAHDNGVVHRDLKPANVQVTPEGKAKVLDFGLAKTHGGGAAASGSAVDPSQSPTMLQATGAGMILGTAAYMSPEQAKGRSVDKRADIWAFGVVLYEMLTGDRLFAGEDLSETLASVIRDEPDLLAVPSKVRRLLGSCLQKDPHRRLRDIGDAWALMDAATEVASPVGVSSSRLAWVVAGVMALITAAVVLAAVPGILREEGVVSSVRFQVPWPTESAARVGTTRAVFSLAPDGRALVMVDEGRLWLRRFDSLAAEPIDKTAGASYPFWSPDGDWIGFFADNQLKKVSLTTGLVQVVCDAPEGRGASWNANGTIIMGAVRGGLLRVSDEGGVARELTATTKDSGSGGAHRYPQFLPGGERFLYLYLAGDPTVSGVYVGALSGASPVRVLQGRGVARYARPAPGSKVGHLLFRRGETLMAQPFDAARAAIVGGMSAVAEGAGEAGNTGYASLAVTDTTLGYSAGAVELGQLTWVDRAGETLGVASPAAPIPSFALSPSGQYVAFTRREWVGTVRGDIWVQELPGGSPYPFTFASGVGWGKPVWSPDGREIAFTTFDRAGLPTYEVRRKASDLSGQGGLVAAQTEVLQLWQWSPDGRYLLYTNMWTGGDLWLMAVDGSADRVLIAGGPGSQGTAQFSPDGRWIAYGSDQNGETQVYVQPYPTTGAVWQISLAGGDMPRWRADGKELFYRGADGHLMALSVDVRAASLDAGTDAVFRHGSPQVLFGSVPRSISYYPGFSYSPSADGQRFLINKPVSTSKPPITLVLNWQPGIER